MVFEDRKEKIKRYNSSKKQQKLPEKIRNGKKKRLGTEKRFETRKGKSKDMKKKGIEIGKGMELKPEREINGTTGKN